MNQTLAPLRDPKISGILADLLCDLIIDIRRILVQPTQNHVKLAAIAAAIDELAPPPPPC
jgi:hypothetical protein